MLSEDLKRDLLDADIESDGADHEAVRDFLIARLASLHPDKTGGAFGNLGQENSFAKIKNLLERLDREVSISSQLIPMNQVVALVDILSKLQPSASANARTREAQHFDQYKHYLKKKYAIPKITSAVLAGLCFMLFSLLGSFRQNTLYRSVVELYMEDGKSAVQNWVDSRTEKLNKQVLALADQVYFANSKIRDLQRPPDSSSDSDRLREELRETPEEQYYRENRSNSSSNTNEPEPPRVELSLTTSSLFEATEPDFLRGAKAVNAQLSKELGTMITTLSSINSTETARKERKADLTAFVGRLQGSVAAIDANIKASEEQLGRQKATAVRTADSRILRRLAIVILCACLMFVLLWIRERSDERWVDLLSTEEGAEMVLARLATNREIAARQPPAFSLTEFGRIVGAKDVPKIMKPIVGSLDSKRLGQISGDLLNKLKRRGLISPRTTPTLQTWFDIRIEDQNAPKSSAE